MSIGKAVRDLIEARGLRPAEVADRLGGKRNRATFYRLLSGETNDPRVSTLLEICSALTTSPSELLQLAGLLQYQERSLKLIDVELRQAFGEMQQLDEDDKRLVPGPAARCHRPAGAAHRGSAATPCLAPAPEGLS